MKVKLIQLYSAKPVLDEFFNTEMPARLSYKLAKIIDIVNPEYSRIEKTRKKLVDKYIEEGEKKVEKNLDQFTKEFNELLDEEAKLEYDPEVSIDDLPDSLEISPARMRLIYFLFKK